MQRCRQETDDHDNHRRRQRNIQDQDRSRDRHEVHEGLHGKVASETGLELGLLRRHPGWWRGFSFCLQISNRPIIGASGAKPTSRWFDFLPVLEPLFGVAGYLLSCSPAVQNRAGAVLLAERFVRRAQSWMNVRTALKMRPGTSTAVPVQTAFGPSDLPVR